MKCVKTLKDLKTGQCGKIKKILSDDSIKRRLLDIGLIEGTCVECVGKSPCGDPSAFLIRGAVIAIRHEDCKKIILF